MSINRDPQSPQPLPVDSGQPKLHDLLSSDIQARKEHGTRKYGHALQAENGRNFLLDIYEEIQDAAVYLKGELEERKKLADMLDRLCDNFGDFFTQVHGDDVETQEMLAYFDRVRARLRIGM